MVIYDKSKLGDVKIAGGKGVGLCKLMSYGMRVPDFFVVAAGTDTCGEGFAQELEIYAKKLNCSTFAVRSSGIAEDGAEESFAGQFSTELGVGRENLLETVRKVASSGENGRVKIYAGQRGAQRSGVAVIVQRQIEGEYSGVMFTTSPHCAEEVVIERVCGAGEALVSGLLTPEQAVFKKCAPPNDCFYKPLLEKAQMLEERESRPLDIEWTYSAGEFYFLQMRPLTACGDSLPDIPDRQWAMYVNRDFCLFNHGVMRIACKKQVQEKIFGFSVPIAEGLIVNGREFYSPENDVSVGGIWARLDKGGFFGDFIKRIKAGVRATKRRADKLKNSDCRLLDVRQLFTLYRREIKEYVKSYLPLMMRPDDYLYGKLVGLTGADRADEICKCCADIKKTYYSEERSSFLVSVISGDADSYLNEYEWILNPLSREADRFTQKRYDERARGLTPDIARARLRATEDFKRAHSVRIKKVVEGLDDNERPLYDLIREFVYLRTYTAENSDRYFFYIRKRILENISLRLNIDMQTLLLMSPEEVMKTQNGFRLSAKEISKRRSGEVIIINDGESRIYYTGKSYQLLKSLLPVVEEDGGAILRGNIACAGEVTARVRIVNNLTQAESFEKGCIVVTSMTVPEIIFALDKACGIITDEGGITCHAAIIAREYGLPCLVGTKNATAILKDGLLVHLDCINGKVQIVNE